MKCTLQRRFWIEPFRRPGQRCLWATLFGVVMLAALAVVGWTQANEPALRVGVHTIRPDTETMARAADLGVDTVVQLFPWREVEPTEGTFFWQMTDETVAGAGFYGLDLIVRLDQPPDWALVASPAPGQPPIDPVAYARFVRAVASRYQGKVAGYIIWNEPNLALEWNNLPPDPAAYVELLRVAHAAVTESDPGAQVISAGLAPTNTNNDIALDDRRFLEAMYQQGAADFFDVLGAHAYGFGRSPAARFVDAAAGNSDLDGLVYARLAALREIMVRHNDHHKPVYITEMGWTVEGVAHSAWQKVTPQQQAAYLLAALERTQEQWPWVALAVVWNVGGETHPEWRGYSLLQPNGYPRPAYTALQTWLQAVPSPATPTPPAAPDRYQVLAEDVIIHLGDAEMPLPWTPLYQGHPRSPRWEGTVYVVDAGTGDWHLTMRMMQSNFWSSRVWVNGKPLSDPLPIDEFSRTWIAHTWTVPAKILRPGPNQIAVTIAHAPPLIQDEHFAYDDLQIKDIVLGRERSSAP